uniref:platelet glycoprotein V n=1 Tax=Epinephelus lanceolatus TaxID=310571 RepID=UPI001446BA1A|nr:platelet glycoprotein V [Epinephelus lanceolatus]
MDSHFRGALWTILILFTLPHLTYNMLCPSSCLCNFRGAVKCVGDTITDIPKQLPVHTYLLQLNGTIMNVINEQSLANRDLLLRFSLTHSHLHTIHPRAFHVAPQLKSVKLSYNDLSTLPARVFSPMTTLEQLHLDGNQLETIAPDMFEGLVGLLDLDLSRNKLSSPSSDVFDKLSSLTFLNLGRNSIKKLPPTIFHSLTNLNQLMLYNNELEVLEPGIFDKLINLEELKIHQNYITSLSPQVFWSLKNLRVLTLSSNRLQAIPEKSFYNMPKLRKLTIYNNPLLSLPDQLMGHMPDIIDFYLYATNLTTVPGNLFANMSGLLRLNFHLNDHLRELPSDLFCCLPKLEKLSLRSNNLHYLHPRLFSGLTTLGILFLNDNKLQSLPDDIFQDLSRVVSIDLKNNQLMTLPGDSFLSNTALKALGLSGNPWDCTCSIRGIAKWIRHNEHVVLDRQDVICHSPTYQLLRTVGSLRDEEFNFCDTMTVTPSYFLTHKPIKTFHTTSTRGQTTVAASTTTPSPKTSTIIQGATQQSTTPSSQPSLHTTVLPTTLQTPTPTLPNKETLPITETPSPPFYDTEVVEQKTTQQVIITTTTPTTKPSDLHTTILPTTLQTPTTILPNKEFLSIPETPSPPFYEMLVIEQGPEFVHHNPHKAWVYVWFLPSDMTMTGLLMFSHILLVVTGLVLILGALFYMYRLNKTVNELKTECAHPPGL